MNKRKKGLIGIDLFAGAGGMSLGAQLAGINVSFAIEKDKHAASTYLHNHPGTKLLIDDIRNLNKIKVKDENKSTVLFGGPPCQGFSTSNQRTRNKENLSNWLFKEFVRIARLWKPEWIVFENVRGIIETEHGLFLDSIISDFEKSGYTCSSGVLCASDFGVPQIRSRFFMIASRNGHSVKMPKPTSNRPITVREAIHDLPSLPNGANENYLSYSGKARSSYAKSMRNDNLGCNGHLVTKNALYVINRYRHIQQGENWMAIPKNLMTNYADRTRCHTGIYYRLSENQPSVVLGNYRKNMLIHPWEDRGLSVREAARLQSFPDWYEFQGSIGFQQQQVGNAVPPLLAKTIFSIISNLEGC